MSKKILLAVDLAWSGASGFAVINQDYDVLDVGKFKPHNVRKKDKLQDKDQNIAWQVYQFGYSLVRKHNLDYVYYEVADFFLRKTAVSALSKAKTAFFLGVVNTGIIPIPIGANEAKVKLCGNKRNKENVAEIVTRRLNHISVNRDGKPVLSYETKSEDGSTVTECKILTDDETDALAIAIVAMDELLMEEMING